MRKLSVLLAAVALVGMTAIAEAQAPLTLTLGPGRNATQPGTVTLTDLGSQVRVNLDMQNGIAAPGQPAHIHVGGCPGVSAVVFPLQNVVNGKSETTLNTTMATLRAQQHAVNVHRSTTEAAVYTACANLPTGAASAAAPAQLPRTGVPGLEMLALLGTSFAGIGYALRRR